MKLIGLACAGALSAALMMAGAASRPGDGSIGALAFMAGSWRGQIEGGVAEEQWRAPEGNNAVGMFRWLKPDGTPIMFEMMALTQEPEGVFLRLVHFNGKLVAREGKDEAVTLRLAESGANRAVFKGVDGEQRVASAGYEVKGEALHVSIHFVDASRPPLEFDFKRAGGR